MIYKDLKLLYDRISTGEIKNLLTDSRNMFTPDSTIFFAIRSASGNDGHKYMRFVYDRGVRYFVAEYVPENFPEDAHIFLVNDTIEALQTIGSKNISNAQKRVAIVGSRGKTMLKEMLFHLLESKMKISRSPRSYNSQIGVPLSLWEIRPGCHLAIIEAGISQKDEMEKLSKIIRPQTVIITNIGSEHNEGFNSREEKIREKLKITDCETVETVIYPADDSQLENLLKEKLPDNKLFGWSFKKEKSNLFIEVTNSEKNNVKLLNFNWGNDCFKLEVKIEKDWELSNFASALAYLLKDGFSIEEIRHNFAGLYLISTRLNVTEGINGCSVILDSYTSDLSSLRPAIDFMLRRKMPFQQPVLILSDLYHSKESDETYREVADLIKQSGIKRFIGIGHELLRYNYLFPAESEFFLDTQQFFKKFSAADFIDEIILLKGSPAINLNEIARTLEARNHETVLEVNLNSIIANYNYFRSYVPRTTGIIAMVKAFGYGMGSYELAKTLQDCGTSILAVATLDEGVELRKNGITMPIMVMNPKSGNYKALFINRLEPSVYSLEMLIKLISEASKNGVKDYPIHIKLDTGMHRMGFTGKELNKCAELIKNSNNLSVKTIFSHLATSDCLDMDVFTRLQLERFEKYSFEFSKNLGYTPKRHILNSAGILRFPEYHYDFVRLGIGLYGAVTLPVSVEKPLDVVATLRTVIICIREIEYPETVGYGRKGEIKEKARIATLPIGYADGINRKLGNGNLRVLINDHYAPTIGNICMDATMVDVTGIECKEGDAVEIFGENIPVQELADSLSTIPYEIFTSISPRVKRIYYRE